MGTKLKLLFCRPLFKWGSLGLLALALLANLGILPYRTVLLSGTSMLPSMRGGDFTLTYMQNDYSVGDVVAYVPNPEVTDAELVVHRIVAKDNDGFFYLKGDNNWGPDLSFPRVEDIKGRVVFVVPGVVGYTLLAFCVGILVLNLLPLKRSVRTL